MAPVEQLTIAGPITSALTHLAGIGASAILQQAKVPKAHFRWTEDVEPRLELASEVTPLEVARLILEHAQQHIEPSSWTQATAKHPADVSKRLFAAGSAGPNTQEDWVNHYAERDVWLAEAAFGWLDLDDHLMTSLGEPAWWLADNRRAKARWGASRWNMRRSEKGREFLQHALSPVGVSVSHRSEQQVLEGLTGVTITDEAAKSEESETATGLTTPRRTDNTLAWCAFWGLAALPTLRRVNGISASTAMTPRTTEYPTRAALPVMTDWTTWAHYRSVVSMRDFAQFSEIETRAQSTPALRAQGVRAVVEFPVLTRFELGSNPRYLLDGDVIPL